MSYKTPFTYGILGGLILIALQTLIYIVNVEWIASPLTSFLYIPLLFLMVWGSISHRTNQGGYFTFGQAFITVFLIGLIGSVLFNLFSFVLIKFIDPNITQIIKDNAMETATKMMERFGAPDDEIEKAVRDIKYQDFSPSLKSESMRHISSLLINSFLSLLIALFVRKKNPNEIES
jgi:hypothetical protein